VIQSILLWFGVECTGLAWCDMVADILFIGKDITGVTNKTKEKVL